MRVPFASTRFTALVAAVVVGGGLASVAAAAPGGGPASSPPTSIVQVPEFTLPLTKVGTVNLSALAKTRHLAKVVTHRQDAPLARVPNPGTFREVDNAILRHRAKGAPAVVPNPAPAVLTGTNVPGERGFSALGGVQQAQTAGGADLEPPDQGLCAGGGYVMEFINNALSVYDGNGAQLVAPVGSPAVFDQPTTDFFSDPRCYYDAPTQRWFLQEFIVGTVNAAGHEATPSVQYEAVSDTADPTGGYTIYSWDTTDAATNGCPCFGDYDNLGADDNGIYVTTDEFGVATPAFNGAIVYAISKEQLETAAATGIVPEVFGYRLAKDPFGQPYIVAPTSTPPGALFAPNTEFFVESDSNKVSDSHLLVYALHDTSLLGAPAAPALYRTEVSTEGYAFPPDATQRSGPRPLGTAYQDPAGQLQADFNAEMEPVYTAGHIYAQLDTATASGSDAVDWFILTPTFSGPSLTTSVTHQGAVAVKSTSLLYPYTAVDAKGQGYLLFSLSGAHTYPGPGYVRYGAAGATGPVIQATAGAAPEDSFTCYAAFVGPAYGGCRWGDYSMGVAMNGRVYMATEMVPQGFRDTLANWGTYIWSAPAP